METASGQNVQPRSTQQVINNYVNPNRVHGQLKTIGDKFSYESSTDGNLNKPLYKLSKDSNVDLLFIGKWLENGSPCVIRRYVTENESDAKNYMRDLEALQTRKTNLHENFIRYFGKVKLGDHTHYAVELCRYSVEELIRNPNTETLYAHVWKSLSREQIMHQTTLGLDYLHGLEGRFIHRNIHGRNVLVAEIPSSSDTHYVVKLSDFRFGKSVLKEGDQQSNTRSPSNWTAPEIENSGTVGPWTDVFILGCFFYYVLSGGHHPFGRNVDQPNRETNIRTNNQPNWTQHRQHTADGNKAIVENYLELMKQMASFNASNRPTTSQILRHFDTKNYYNIYPVIGPSSSTDSKTITGASTRPGLCVIFHQDTFDNEPKEKTRNLIGYRKDVKSLCKTFWLFGYDVRIYADLTAQQLQQTVEDLAKEKESNGSASIFKGYASLVVCILSHGGPGTVEGVDGKSVRVNKLQWAFSREKCRDLQDKAKIFFIQACQGNERQNAIEITYNEACNIHKQHLETAGKITKAVAEAAATPFSNNSSGETAADVKNTTMMKAQFSDVVTMWATIIDYKSYVYPETGSSFIQSLCYHLVNSQGGTRITGGDRIRDLHDAHLAITQEVSSQPIYVKETWKWNPKTNKYILTDERVNQTPLYQSTACGKKVGFQIVAEDKRCKQINCFAANKDYIVAIWDGSSNIVKGAAASTRTFPVTLDETDDALELVWHPHTAHH